MSEPVNHSLLDRWNAFAQHYGIKDFQARPAYPLQEEVLYIEVRAGEISAPFEAEEQTLNALRNFGLKLLEPQGSLGTYITMLLIEIPE